MNTTLPEGEQQRLETLRRYQILDTEPEPEFDDIALLAAQICGVPRATVSLIDEQRQWFRATTGTERSAPPEAAFCAQVILQTDEVMEIRDASLDRRLRDNPLVVSDPHVRFFAGSPLMAPDGTALGALCVMDQTPRTLQPAQVEALGALSRQVMRQLELRRQARQLASEAAERGAAEEHLTHQYEEMARQERESTRVLQVAERSRRALLGLLEDEKLSGLKLRESEERFRQITENITEVFWITEPAKPGLLYVSPAYELIWGRSCESLYANPGDWWGSIHPDDRARVVEATKLRQVVGDYHEVYRIVRPGGAERWIRDRAFPVRNERGEVHRIVGTAQDITESKRAELREAVEHAVTGVLSEGGRMMDTARRVLEVVCRRLEWDLGDLWIYDRSSKTLHCVEVWHPASSEFGPFAEASRRMTFSPGEGLPGRVCAGKAPQWLADVTQDESFRRRAQAEELGLRGALAFPIKLRGEIFGVVEVFSIRSRTPDPELLEMFAALGTQIGQFIERKELEDQFRQAQKMEAIGTLAGGIAHDFNNVLAAIIGFTELAKMESTGNPQVMEYLQSVLQGSERAADLVRQILAFSRQQEQQRRPVQLAVIVEEALRLLRATIPATIEFETSVAQDGPQVLADSTQIHQVIMNLATNAAHAMKDRAGRLGVGLETIDVDADMASAHPGFRVGRYLRLSVSDSGHGMDQATLSRIFDPFFTTKGPGEGTGLGLAVVHGIVQSHEGVITVYSHPGEGTRFNLYFPAESGELTDAIEDATEVPPGSGQRILFVDDEPPLASVGKRILERLGYAVECFTDPGEALATFSSSPGRFHAAVTDMAMAGMTGIELSQQLLKLRPDLPILLTTGYSATLTLERARGLGIRDLVLKPLTIRSLGEAIHRLLVTA